MADLADLADLAGLADLADQAGLAGLADSKNCRPPDPGPLLPRERLRSWIGPRTAAWLLLGGPGSGKTATASQIAEHLGRPVRWFEDPPEPDTLARLSNAFPQGVTAVFNGADAWLERAGCADLLEAWLRVCKSPVFTVVTSRRPLPFGLTRRKALDEVRFLDPADLWFSPEEVRAFLGSKPGGSGSAVDAVLAIDAGESPEAGASASACGWPLALQCLKVSAPGIDAAELIRALVDEELLGHLPPDARRLAAQLAGLPGDDPRAAASDLLRTWGLWNGRTGAWFPFAREGLKQEWLSALAQATRLKRSGDYDGLDAWLSALPPAATTRPEVALIDGARHQARGAFPEAAHRFEMALAGFREREDRAGIFEALGDLLHLHWTTQDFETFRLVATEAQPYEADGTPGERIEYYNNLACFEFGTGEEGKARLLFQRALDYPHLGDAQIASVQQFASINLGILEMERGEFDKATMHYERVLALADRFPLKRSVSQGARLYLASMALRLGDRRQAETRIRELEADPFPVENSFRQAEFMVLEGDYHLLTGAHDRAEERYRAALTAFAAIRMDGSAEAGAATNRLAVIHRRRAEPEAAMKLHAQAAAMVGDWPRYVVAVALDWAITLLGTGCLDEADLQLSVALEALGKAPAPHLEGGVMLARAVLARRNARFADAKAALERALSLIRQGPYYYEAIARRELAPEVWALLAETGNEAMLAKIESHFPQAARSIRLELQAAASAQAEPVILPPAAPPAIEIRCFGGLEVRVAGQSITTWPRKKTRALLGHLLVAPRGLSREELSDRLFPDLGLDEAEHQLDNLTSTLRKLLEPELARRQKSRFLAVKDRLYRFEAADAWIDLSEFDAAYEEGSRAWRDGKRSEAVLALERCAGLYRGDLLAEPFLLEWFDLERQQCKSRAVDSLALLAEHCLDNDQPEPARAHLERIVSLDPTNEDAHRRLLRLFSQFGRSDLVRRQWELCAAAVRRELETEPAPETAALFKQLIS